MYFNPRPRKEGDYDTGRPDDEPTQISIHALVKRATTGHALTASIRTISIHALVKRATLHRMVSGGR